MFKIKQCWTKYAFCLNLCIFDTILVILYYLLYHLIIYYHLLIIIKQWLKITIKLKINKKEIKENLTNNKIINYRHHIFLY